MGFIQPAPPPVDMEEWRKLPHLARLRPLVQDWGINGFGTPEAVYLLYIFKLVVFSFGAALVISAPHPASAASATSTTGGPSRSSGRSWRCGRSSGRGSDSAPARCR